jgi:biopolymer transport protein ExbD
MKMSRRARRMERHHKRFTRTTALNMVSLMDIFTILVFFLLINSSSGEVLPSTKTVKLPESLADKKPKETVTILVNRDSILVQGRKVADVSSTISSPTPMIPALKEELDLQTRAIVKRVDPTNPFNGEVTIMGDKEIPYRLLKKIMLTCTMANYGNISLAVMQKVEAKAKGS